ncbi:hypothetical protein E4L95_02435 [Paracoccus liaowanqingii]|uniref:DUF4384 domain-containing protein n=1 Tax=Paracoccus liaowanqingii TaxID=2560053 RepID=A0A4Z1CSQ1_9RHOB|nr:hypothetical protein [Paracoccus liaowanqingii]TGN68136.1 hypothetical protein E4L95_02435 [Paracoccus liaowanqingii]
MIRVLILMLLPGLAWAETRPPTGLLAVASPLPATIPFQVRAPEGQDYAIVLTDPEGARVISAYLRGGSVLRLLVPPGDHRLTVAPGPPEDWQGPEDLFGAPAATLPGPLPFRIANNRREGQSITLERAADGLRIGDRQDRTTCQIAEWSTERVTKTTPLGTELRWLDPELSTRSRPCD